MSQKFASNPVINSPYSEPDQHWALDESGKPLGNCREGRRNSSYLVPIPKARRRRLTGGIQGGLDLENDNDVEENKTVNRIRTFVGKWRTLSPEKWNVTSTTEKLMKHWRDENKSLRLFFCQIEAAETLIWLNEVAPKTSQGKKILQELEDASKEANPYLPNRLAAKMATGSGKTMVMAMMIAYHTINKARYPKSNKFSGHFLIVTPGITIRDRLRVLLPYDPENYYEKRDVVPPDMRGDIKKARVFVTNYHSFILRENLKLSTKQREVIKGHNPDDVQTKETEGEMLARQFSELLRAKDVLVINDEAHHCYRHKVVEPDEGSNDGRRKVRGALSGEDAEEAKQNNKDGHIWISGIEALTKKTKVRAVYDLSATPFFLRGSGYPEGRLFPWVVSDFALMDAIESGVVKVPRVPVDDCSTEDIPIYRNVYVHVREHLPRRGRNFMHNQDPDNLPSKLLGALHSLYDNYKKTSDLWEKEGIGVPPVFILVCNNSSTSKLLCDYIGGYEKNGKWKRGELDLFSNVAKDGSLFKRPNTLLIDSYQLESGDALSPEFKKVAALEIEQFKQDIRVRDPGRDVDKITDADLLREAMNTVGKQGKIGEQVRCVVSISMLTEGWDANNVTHILGVRAFGTQLLCEQVVGRALRRWNYDVDENDMLEAEYADIFGVPFAFAADGGGGKKPKTKSRVRNLDERAILEIRYPRIRGYKIRPSEECLKANFDENSRYVLNPEDAPPKSRSEGIVGKGEDISLDELRQFRLNEVFFHVAARTAKKYADENGYISPARFRDLLPIVRQWMSDYLTCLPGTFPQYFLWREYAEMAAERIYRACVRQTGEDVLLPMVDPFTPEGSTFYVDFLTSKKRLYESEKSHVNIAVCDSSWEMTLCQLLEDDKNVYSYARNVGLGFEVPYTADDQKDRVYIPDFIALINDGDDPDNLSDLLHLIVETKGYRNENARTKADTMNRLWVPAVNNDGRWGRWAFLEIMDIQNAREKLAKFTQGACARVTE